MKKLEDKIFIIVLIIIIFCGFIKPLIVKEKINYLENRNAYTMPKFTIKNVLNKSYQNDFEKALSDQLPMASKMKITEKTISLLANLFYLKMNPSNYMNLGSGVFLFDDYLVYEKTDLNKSKDSINKRVENINKTVNNNHNVEFYLYYIEKETDIDIFTNEHIEVYNYITNMLDDRIITNNFRISDINDFKKYYYKTDHHWNYIGSYIGYKDLATMMGVDNLIGYEDEVCFKQKMVGSRAARIGGQQIFQEEFCAYKFIFPQHKVYINNNLTNKYGNYQSYFDGSTRILSYENFYGGDPGLIEFDYNNPSKDNLLIIGDSFDNAINEILASHFNKTYNVDLRYYKSEINKDFNINEFIKLHEINKVLLIGNIDFYKMEVFSLN